MLHSVDCFPMKRGSDGYFGQSTGELASQLEEGVLSHRRRNSTEVGAFSVGHDSTLAKLMAFPNSCHGVLL